MNEASSSIELVLLRRRIYQKKLHRLLFVVAAILLIIIALFISDIAGPSGAATRLSDSFIKHIQENDPTKAYELFSDETKKTTTEDKFADQISQVSLVVNGTPVIDNKDISSDKATITYDIMGSDDLKYYVTIALAKNGDQWRVEGFNSENEQAILVKNFVKYIQSNLYENAYDLLSKSARSANAYADFQTKADSIRRQIDGEAKILSKNVKNDSAEITFSFGTNDETGMEYMIINLEKENGAWKINNYEFKTTS